jgi:hypothetical protein
MGHVFDKRPFVKFMCFDLNQFFVLAIKKRNEF